MHCKPKILIDGNNMNVVQCAHCNRVGLYYKNILVGFSLRDFFSFSNSVSKLDFNERSVFFTDNNKHLVINTCHQDIQLSFVKEEFEELIDTLSQARLLIEAGYYAQKT